MFSNPSKMCLHFYIFQPLCNTNIVHDLPLLNVFLFPIKCIFYFSPLFLKCSVNISFYTSLSNIRDISISEIAVRMKTISILESLKSEILKWAK